MHRIETAADPLFSSRTTAPVLYEKATDRVVSNESGDILRKLNVGFDALASGPHLPPKDLQPEIGALNDRPYARFDGRVYRAGCATTQVAYEEAFDDAAPSPRSWKAAFQVNGNSCSGIA